MLRLWSDSNTQSPKIESAESRSNENQELPTGAENQRVNHYATQPLWMDFRRCIIYKVFMKGAGQIPCCINCKFFLDSTMPSFYETVLTKSSTNLR